MRLTSFVVGICVICGLGFFNLNPQNLAQASDAPMCFLSDGDADGTVYGRGCCSYHGGVCGCQVGRALCCDGELSPSCGC